MAQRSPAEDDAGNRRRACGGRVEAAFSPLFELLKFRHFKRYYFELEYDWDRLDYLVAKLSQAHPLVMHDLERFARFMGALEES